MLTSTIRTQIDVIWNAFWTGGISNPLEVIEQITYLLFLKRLDGLGRMEIDLLCADSRIVVEIDGGQHLADPVAYRRDRRKDQLLQENGYLVLRFLAEDLAKELDSVLDTILRSLSSRRTLPESIHALRVMPGSRP